MHSSVIVNENKKNRESWLDDLILWDYLDYPALDEVKLNQEKNDIMPKNMIF